jgi:hypothetical protein
MATKNTKAGFDFLVEALKANKDTPYAELAAAAKEQGVKIYPVMFGRAKALLGQVKSAKRGAGKAAAKAKAKSSPGSGRRGRQVDPNSMSGKIRELLKTGMTPGEIAAKLGCTPALVYNVRAKASAGPARVRVGRPKAAPTAVGTLDAIVEAVRASSRETERLRAAVAKIAAVLEAL